MHVSSPQYRNLIVAIDIHSTYEPVLARALSMADSNTKLSLIYVTLPQVYFEPYAMNVGHDFMTEIKQKAQQRLLEIAKANGIAEENAFVVVGNAAEEIHRFVEQNQCDLIVIGTHGRSGLKLLLGSTANSVLHGATCDVLSVRV